MYIVGLIAITLPLAIFTVSHEGVSGVNNEVRPGVCQKALYRWKKNKEPQLPSCLSGPPPQEEHFHIRKSIQFYSQAILDKFKEYFRGLTINLSRLHGYEEYAKVLKVPPKNIHTDDFSRWMLDEEFGRQILNGVNPVVIRKCEQLPTKFPVTQEMVQSSLCRGLTLEEEIKVSLWQYILGIKIMASLQPLAREQLFMPTRFLSLLPTPQLPITTPFGLVVHWNCDFEIAFQNSILPFV